MRPQVFCCEVEPDPEHVMPIQNDWGGGAILKKPLGGMWTSSLREDGISSWMEWKDRENWYIAGEKFWILTINEDATLYHIDTVADLEEICEEYIRRDRGTPRLGESYIDFEKMDRESEYDGIHLTQHGEIETRHSNPSLYGWDAESTVWFDWHFDLIGEYERAGAGNRLIQV